MTATSDPISQPTAPIASRISRDIRARVTATQGDPAAEAALLAELTADARRRAGLTDSAAAPLLAAARAPRLELEHARIHAADLRRIEHRPDRGEWLARVRAAVSVRAKGDPAAQTLRNVAQTLAYFHARAPAQGWAQVTFGQMAAAAQLCCDTVRRAVRWLEAAGLLDCVNVLERRTTSDGFRRLVRAGNCYLIPPAGAGAVPAAPSAAPAAPAPSAAQRLAQTLQRWGAHFGLAIRRRGWNASPLRTLRTT